MTPLIRAVVIAVLAAVGGYQVWGGRAAGGFLLAAGALLTYGHFRYGAVGPAWSAVKAKRYDRAKALIGTIKRPHLLGAQHRAYYHFTQGVLEMHAGRFAQAAEHLTLAANGALRTSHDQSTALMTLAEAMARAGDVEAARTYLAQARDTPHKAGLDDALRQVGTLVDGGE